MSGQAHHHYTGDIGGCYYPDIWGLHGIAVNHYKDQLSNNQAHHLFFVFYLGGGLKMFPKQKPEHSKPTLRGRTQHGSLLCQCLDSNRGSRFRNGGPQWEALMVPFKLKLVDADVWCFFWVFPSQKKCLGHVWSGGKRSVVQPSVLSSTLLFSCGHYSEHETCLQVPFLVGAFLRQIKVQN